MTVHRVDSRTFRAIVGSSMLLLCACGERRSPSILPLSAAPTVAEATPVSASAGLAEAPDRYVQVGDITIRYRVIGTGPALLMLHGYTDRVEMWTGLADSLARAHRVIVPDLRGFGKSTVPRDTSQYGLAMMRDLIALLDELEEPAAHVVGYSMGGLLAAHLALEVPSRVLSLTLLAGAFTADVEEARRDVVSWADSIDAGRGLAPFFAWILPTFSAEEIAGIAAQMEADNDRHALVHTLRAFPSMVLPWSQVAKADIPAVVAVGTADPLRRHSLLFAGRWPAAKVIEVAGANHADIYLSPSALTAVRQAVASASGRRAGTVPR